MYFVAHKTVLYSAFILNKVSQKIGLLSLRTDVLAFAGGVLSLCVCVVFCVCTGEEQCEMKAHRDSHEDRQRQQVVLGALLLRMREGGFCVNRSIIVGLGEDYPFQIV